MKAYVILAHKNPAQLLRLIRSLDDGESTFFIHIDRRADIANFSDLALLTCKWMFIPRVKTVWASMGLVQAVLNGLKAIKDAGVSVRQIILLSGQDYPIKSNEYINRFIDSHRHEIFLEYSRLPNFKRWKPNGGLYRVNKYFFGLKTYQRYTAKAANLLATFVPLMRRKGYQSMTPYAGSMWWMINEDAANYILNFVDQHPLYTVFHKYTFAADEVFFHTILVNAGNALLSSAIVNDDKRFIRWTDIDASHPEMLGEKDMSAILDSKALFARKFDDKDQHVLDLIDQCR